MPTALPASTPSVPRRGAPTRPRPPVTCPVCDGVADVVVSGVVEYDRCRSCGGVWLDCGELEVLLALAHRAGKERAMRSAGSSASALTA